MEIPNDLQNWPVTQIEGQLFYFYTLTNNKDKYQNINDQSI